MTDLMNHSVNRVLAIDDDMPFLNSLKELLRFENYLVDTYQNPSAALEAVQSNDYDCILLDVKMPGMDGIEMLKRLNGQKSKVPVIMISGQSTIRIAVEAIKKGAYDFIEKPLEPERLFVALKNAIEKNTLAREKNILVSELGENNRLIGESPAMLDIFKKIKTLASANTKVLITGETGTGKELVAKALHYHSDRVGKPYIKLNCAAIPPDLLESELFGHKKGSFTGAWQDKHGKFKAADNGTLFLDEIGDLEVHLQAKLLRVLEEGEFEMLGSTESIRVDCRIISATNRDLEKLIRQGKFRADLYHRLNVVNIHIPPLRERREDISLLAKYFLVIFNDTYNKKIYDFSDGALQTLASKDWPGNIRELRNVVEKTVIYTSASQIDEEDLLKALRV